MATDGRLKDLFREHIPDAHWQPIETGGTGRGIPDLNYCVNSVEGWIECKFTKGDTITIYPEQVAWIERRARAGGRVLVAVRQKRAAGPRRGPAHDRLILLGPWAARRLVKGKLSETPSLHTDEGGPKKWQWHLVRHIMGDHG